MSHKPLESPTYIDDRGGYIDEEPLVPYGHINSDVLPVTGESKRGAIIFPLFLTLVTVLLTAGFAAALLAWLITHHAVQGQSVLETLRQNRAFIVDEGTREGGTEARLIGLTISSIASSLIGITIPFMMTLYAYRVASVWIATSNSRDMTAFTGALPTPLQYGLLSRLLGSLSFLSLFDTFTYVFRRHRPALPGILSNSLMTCAFVFTLAHLVSATDIWVHFTTHAILDANFTRQIEAEDMSIKFNESLCSNISPVTPCFQGPDSWGGGDDIRPNGFLIAANSSAIVKIVTLSEQEDTALMVPVTVNTDTRFNATSFVSRVQCISLNPQCLTSQRDGMTVVESCANIGLPEIPVWGQSNTALNFIHPIIDGKVYQQTDSIELWPRSFNPFELAVQLRWPTLSTDASVQSANTAVDSDDANSTMSLYAACTFTFLNVTYSYGDSAFAIIREEVMNPNVSNVFWGPLINQLANDRLASDMQAVGQGDPSADNVVALLRQDLGRLGLGMIGGALVTSPESVQQEAITTKTLGRYDAVPVFVLVALLGLYALFALYIYALTLFARAPRLPRRLGAGTPSQLDLAHRRLTSPLPLVADLFRPHLPSLAARLSVAESAMRMFEESAETSRLVVGLRDEGRFPTYGVRRRFEYEDEGKDG